MLNIDELTRLSTHITHHLMAMNDLKPFIIKKQSCNNSLLLVWSTRLYTDSCIKCFMRASDYSCTGCGHKISISTRDRVHSRYCRVFTVLAHIAIALPVWESYFAFKVVLVSHLTISESVSVIGLMPCFFGSFFMWV